MKQTIIRIVAVLALVLGVLSGATGVYADEEGNESEATTGTVQTSLTLTPVSRTLQISPSSVYDGKITVSNDGADEARVIAYGAPYFYTYSEQESAYKLNFSSENNYTQIARWITIKGPDGNYTTTPSFKIPAGEKLDIEYRITTPDSIPAGGQYGAIFVQTNSGAKNSEGIHTETSAGMVLYGHSTSGETITKAEIMDMQIKQGGVTNDGVSNNHIRGIAKVKNAGNVDFFAKGKLTVEPIIGFSSYNDDEKGATVSIIPESERTVEEEWAETPSFGVYKVTWTITAGEETQTIEQIVFLIDPILVIFGIIILTIVIVFIIIGVRKRKERRSRLAI